jgi:hypothetical protein
MNLAGETEVLGENLPRRDRGITQAVSRWLPTAAVRGSRPGRHVGFCGGQSGAGAGFFLSVWGGPESLGIFVSSP